MPCYSTMLKSVWSSMPLYAVMWLVSLPIWESEGLGSNKVLLPWPKENLMIQGRNGRNVGYLPLCMLDKAPQMRFIPIKTFSLLLKTITESLYSTRPLANVHIPQSLPYQLLPLSGESWGIFSGPLPNNLTPLAIWNLLYEVHAWDMCTGTSVQFQLECSWLEWYNRPAAREAWCSGWKEDTLS